MSGAVPRRGVVAVIARRRRLLVVRRAESVREAPGAFCFPGGAIESGESERDALVRELQEELGVASRPVARLWQSVAPWHVELSWWQAELPPGVPLRPDPAEVASIHWHTLEELRNLADLLESNRQFLDALDEGRIELPLC